MEEKHKTQRKEIKKRETSCTCALRTDHVSIPDMEKTVLTSAERPYLLWNHLSAVFNG
jgi:hypothetical protein